MAAFQGTAVTAEVALSAATAKTVLQILAAANHRVKILRWWVTFDGTTSGNDPVLVELVRQSTAGTSSALTPRKVDDSLAETLLTTAVHTATAEPTTGDTLDTKHVHPQSGYEVTLPFGAEVVVGGGDRVGIRCTAPQAVNVVAGIHFEE